MTKGRVGGPAGPAADVDPAVDVAGVTIRYGAVPAVRDLWVRVEQREIVALLGPNGAGKSSLLRALCALQKVHTGTVRVFGADVDRDPMRVRQHLGVVFQEPTLDRDLSVARNLRFHARLYGVPRSHTSRRIAELLEGFGLSDRAGTAVQELSGGLARRVELARAMLHRPRLLVLDEPTTALDPESRAATWRDLARLRDLFGLTIVYSTHYLDEAEYADRILIVREGELIRDGAPTALKTALNASFVHLVTSDDEAAAHALTRAGHLVTRGPDGLRIPTERPEDTVAVLVMACAVPVRSVSVQHPTLDDVFLAALLAPSRQLQTEAAS
jgi:ABC-2 type transport system ATP-binding protein